MSAGRFLRTIAPLTPTQLLWRARYALERRRAPRAIDVPEAGEVRRLVATDFPELPPARPHRGAPPSEPVDWMLGPRRTKRLEAIELHYHEWAREAPRLLEDWLARCDLEQPGARELAWNSYAIATRLVSWARLQQVAPLDDSLLQSFFKQARYLEDHVEWDLLGNHVVRDAVGLACAGRFFTGPHAERWLEAGTTIALDEARAQVLQDGAHYERSPMYHLHVMSDLATLIRLVRDETARARLEETWKRMAEYRDWMRHPDGEITLLNDAALGYAPVEHERRRGARYFDQAGHVVWHGDPWSVFLDVGEVGPDVQPGHAHADTLTFECSLRGERLVVDPGTLHYDDDEARRYDRSTRAHNTITIDGADSSEVWHIFRVGRRAHPRDVRVEIAADGLITTASHTGYDHLPGRPRHTRRLEVRDGGPLVIEDEVQGVGIHRLEGGFLLAPGPRRASLVVTGSGNLERFEETRPYHPSFGVERETTRVSWRCETSLPFRVKTVITPAS